MGSSKVYVDEGVLVPDAIMELFRAQPRVYINPPIEQRPGPAPQYIVNDRIWVDEPMREFLKALEPQLPKPVLLHFRGYGRETGTAVINLESIYWTHGAEEYCRLDFKHPEEMQRLHGCPNFWGAFILAMMPVSEFKDVCVADQDGREFVRLCDEAMKAQTGGAMDAFQRVDWSKVPPEHPVCETLVEVPTVRIQPRGLNYPHRPAEFEGQEEIVVQWYGDNDRGELKDRNMQFAFPLMSKPDAVQWFGHPEWFRTVMLGPLKNWPNKEALAQMVRDGRKPDSTVIYVITSQIGRDNGRGQTVPTALLIEVACLGDPTFGVIRPREYTNLAVSDEEVAKLTKPRPTPTPERSEPKKTTIGSHQRIERSDSKDVNGRFMVTCRDCETCAHAYRLEDAEADLAKAPCVKDCANCNKLRRSYDGDPAVPTGGSCNDELHICPRDGRRWWQSNTHFHLWQQVTDDREWEVLNRQRFDQGGRDRAWSR